MDRLERIFGARIVEEAKDGDAAAAETDVKIAARIFRFVWFNLSSQRKNRVRIKKGRSDAKIIAPDCFDASVAAAGDEAVVDDLQRANR